MSKIIVIGASQGGMQALRTLAAGLPEDFPMPVLAVQHIGSTASLLPVILDEAGPLEADFAIDGEPILPGRIYVAPPDHHMLVNDGHIELTRGPRENWARPAVDPLFRSAAAAHGADAIAIVLSGRLNDGTAGLFEIKRLGGVAIVQTPREAESPDMPQSALDNVAVDYCLKVAEMPGLLMRLGQETSRQEKPFFPQGPLMEQDQELDRPCAQTCPECGGAMRKQSLGGLTSFRCHIGHVMTAEVVAATQLDKLENTISAILRTLNERAALCRDMAARHREKDDMRAVQAWTRAAEEAERREKTARELVNAEWLHPEANAEIEKA